MRAEAIARLLPDVIRRTAAPGSVLESVLSAAEGLHAPVEDVLADFDTYIDPYRCPPRFLPYLCDWVGFGWLLTDEDGGGVAMSERAMRDLVSHAPALAASRGTSTGLVRMLEVATELQGFAIHDEAQPFRVTVTGPPGSAAHEDLVARIVRHDKPAFAVVELRLTSLDDPAAPEPPPVLGQPTPLLGPAEPSDRSEDTDA